MAKRGRSARRGLMAKRRRKNITAGGAVKLEIQKSIVEHTDDPTKIVINDTNQGQFAFLPKAVSMNETSNFLYPFPEYGLGYRDGFTSPGTLFIKKLGCIIPRGIGKWQRQGQEVLLRTLKLNLHVGLTQLSQMEALQQRQDTVQLYPGRTNASTYPGQSGPNYGAQLPPPSDYVATEGVSAQFTRQQWAMWKNLTEFDSSGNRTNNTTHDVKDWESFDGTLLGTVDMPHARALHSGMYLRVMVLGVKKLYAEDLDMLNIDARPDGVGMDADIAKNFSLNNVFRKALYYDKLTETVRTCDITKQLLPDGEELEDDSVEGLDIVRQKSRYKVNPKFFYTYYDKVIYFNDNPMANGQWKAPKMIKINLKMNRSHTFDDDIVDDEGGPPVIDEDVELNKFIVIQPIANAMTTRQWLHPLKLTATGTTLGHMTGGGGNTMIAPYGVLKGQNCETPQKIQIKIDQVLTWTDK